MDLRKLCRICFADDAAIDITEHKTSVRSLEDATSDCEEEQTILQIMLTMHENSQHISLELAAELPMICKSCLDECLLHYAYFSKIVLSNRQLRQLYNEAVELAEQISTGAYVDENADAEADNQTCIEYIEEEQPEAVSGAYIDNGNDIENAHLQKLLAPDTSDIDMNLLLKTSKRVASDDALVVSQFLPPVPATGGAAAESYYPPFKTNEVHTVSYAAVQLKHNEMNDYNEANRLQDMEPSNSQVVYKCQYCPVAYVAQQFLKVHVRKCHVCKYCTTGFSKTKDLNEHIRSEHSKHQCAICLNNFSSGSNLRAHLKRVHGVQLPAHVSLLDYKPALEFSDTPTDELDESDTSWPHDS